MLNNFLKLVQSEPSRGSQVKNLLLNRCFDYFFDRTVAFNLFPNLQFFYLDVEHYLFYSDGHMLDLPPKHIKSLRDQIVHIADCVNSNFVWDLLNSGVCSRLTTLELNLKFHNESPDDGFLVLLSNAPALKNLELQCFRMTIESFEKMHSYLPHLSSFRLVDGPFGIVNLPDKITPAVAMETLSLSFGMFGSRSIYNWFQYFCMKYPYLLHFSFSKPFSFVNLFGRDDLEMGTDQEGLALLLQNLGSQLKSLTPGHILLTSDLFKKFNEFGCQIANLDGYINNDELFFQTIAPPKQCSYIQVLKLQNLEVFPIELLKEMIVLKTLELKYHNHKGVPIVNLNDILKSCSSTLEILTIKLAQLECDTLSTELFSIKELTINGHKIPEALDKFLLKHCPKIHSLTLIDCLPDTTKLELTDIHLSRLKLDVNDLNPHGHIKEPHIDLLVKTSIDKKERFYSVGEKIYYRSYSELNPNDYKHLLYKHITPSISYIKLTGGPFVTVECASIKKLILNGRSTA
ncbi:hypothetical protein K501DRAFT_285058 [Backusella circina FSU 941]|nr:hypothetical protein K501DRAFT_285058 [Backusella circina FSU 941]